MCWKQKKHVQERKSHTAQDKKSNATERDFIPSVYCTLSIMISATTFNPSSMNLKVIRIRSQYWLLEFSIENIGLIAR